ncbi:hypothetical protein [Aquisalimonas sp.]|uniref:hypothetical protein n=1 Tax=Aquisalimonas sp. TaxID=1872621 RepID=UPI0025C2BC21|nr:hypothetical protein [Aquisalimonas sp.]
MAENPEQTSLRAAIDQVCKVREEQAREVGAYYRGLRAEGVPRALAWALVRDWHGWRAQDEFREDDG